MPEAAGFSDSHSPSAIPVDPARQSLIDVVLPRHLYRVFTYLVPAHLQPHVRIGSRVKVPFGHAVLHGMVVALQSAHAHPAAKSLNPGSAPLRLREITAILSDADDETPMELLTLTRLISEHYLAPWGQCIRLLFPARPSSKIPARYQLTEAGRHLLENEDASDRLTASCRNVLTQLNRRPKGLTIPTLRRALGSSPTKELSMLKRRKLIREAAADADTSRRPHPVTSERSPQLGDSPGEPEFANQCALWCPQSLTERARWKTVLTALQGSRSARFLFQADRTPRVSAAFEAADAALKQRRRVIMITPDIARAEAIAAAAQARWSGQVELFHSGLPVTVRHERWDRIRSGSVMVVVGTRSAVFAPMPGVGLIYIDDEESGSLKEETEPRYHVRDVAWMRAQLTPAVVVLGSAHPSVETMHAFTPGIAEASNTAVGLVQEKELPDVQTVDLRQTTYGTLLSDPMIAGIRSALDARSGVILFLNRKGFAPALVCRDCGNAPHCTQCSVALTFYKQADRLACHYCGTSRSLPDTCDTCRAARLQPSGGGTEAVEEWARRLFPRAKIGRLDREASASTRHASAIRGKFIRGELDLLIGTQMLCQGAPALSAGFVGLIQADAGLHLPDFRASEQTYHTLMDAVALARPKQAGGRIVLQTLLPTHYVIQAVAHHKPTLFYAPELAFRQALAYPPFAHLIGLRVCGTSPDRTKQAAQDWVKRLKTVADRHTAVWGPIPSAVAKLREKYRWQIVVKSTDGAMARECVQQTLAELEVGGHRSGMKFEVDVDPLTML